MRQAAWLQAVPREPGKKKTDRRNRAQRIRDKGGALLQPPLRAAQHLINYLFEIGPAIHGSMGLAPLSHCEIAAWMGSTGIRLQPWELRAMHNLSRQYVAEYHQAEDPERPAPYGEPERQFDRAQLDSNIRAALRPYVKSTKKGKR